MKKQQFLLVIGFFMTILSACNSKTEPAIEGNWDLGDDYGHCTITKQEGGLVMQTSNGEQYVFEKKSSEMYTAQMGMVTLVYTKDSPSDKSDCRNAPKVEGHWRLSKPGGSSIKLLKKEEKC
jgi:hypothetical protein